MKKCLAAAVLFLLLSACGNQTEINQTPPPENDPAVTEGNLSATDDGTGTTEPTPTKPKVIGDDEMLKAVGKNLYTASGEPVNLRGVNVGGWLLQEFWLSTTTATARVRAEIDIYEVLTERFGKETMLDLVKLYQDNYFTAEDFDRLQAIGVNCLRLPFWYRNIVDEAGEFYPNWQERFDWFIREAGKRGMYVILDMHGAPGSQNGSDHSGVDGEDRKEDASEFFFGENAEKNQALYYTIWEELAKHYNNNPVVAGYDLLNEPYCTYRYNAKHSEKELHTLLWGIYDEAYKRIRAIDSEHIIIMEATWDPVDLPNPGDYNWDNVMYQYHNYLYDDYNNEKGQQIANMERKINAIKQAGYNVPCLMGEFSYFSKTDTWREGLELLNDSGISWTIWTYKVTGQNGNWGLYHQYGSDVNLETATEEEIRTAWSKVGNAQENVPLLKVVTEYVNAPYAENTLGPKTVHIPAGLYHLQGLHAESYVCLKDDLSLGGDGAEPTAIYIHSLSSGLIYFRTEDGAFVRVNPDTKRLTADGQTEDEAATFKPFLLSENTYSFMFTGDNMYVCTDENLGGFPLVANRMAASSWESFVLTTP